MTGYELAGKHAFRLDAKGRRWEFTHYGLYCPDSGEAHRLATKEGSRRLPTHAVVMYCDMPEDLLRRVCAEAMLPEAIDHRERDEAWESRQG